MSWSPWSLQGARHAGFPLFLYLVNGDPGRTVLSSSLLTPQVVEHSVRDENVAYVLRVDGIINDL